jgi:ribosome-associated protein
MPSKPPRIPSWIPPPPSPDAPPSKTRLKQESHELQSLGKDLLDLTDARLAALDLPETLRHAIGEFKRTRSHEGKRRQLQFVGKLMRGVDPGPLREAVAAQRLPGARETLLLHQAEAWRERLATHDNALTEWMQAHPDDDSQALRNLIRNARKEATAAAAAPGGEAPRKGKAWRDLFVFVRDGLREDAAPPDADDETPHQIDQP